LVFQASHGAEFGGADRSEVLGMGEQDGPTIPDPIMKMDCSLRRFGGEVRRGVVDAKAHAALLELRHEETRASGTKWILFIGMPTNEYRETNSFFRWSFTDIALSSISTYSSGTNMVQTGAHVLLASTGDPVKNSSAGTSEY